MTTELVTAHAGKNHIGSEDVGALYAGALGSGRFAFDVGEGLAVTMTDANTVRIGTGVFLMDGRQVRVKEAESVKVANGSQGAFRRDLVTYTYKRDPSNGNVEEGAWSVLQGTAAASEAEAKAPDYVAGNILDGDITATVAVAEVSLSGLTPTARLLLPSVASLRTLGDSVSQDILHRVIRVVSATIDGWAGKVTVTTNMFDETGSTLERGAGCFFQMRVFVWTKDIGGDPWRNAVQPPDNPSGSGYWWVRVPVKVGDGTTQMVTDGAMIFEYVGSGYLSYSGTSGRDIFISRDGYPYIAIGEEDMFVSGTSAIISVDTTVFISRPASVTG